MDALRLGQRLRQWYKGAVEADADAGGADSPPARLRPSWCKFGKFQATIVSAVSLCGLN